MSLVLSVREPTLQLTAFVRRDVVRDPDSHTPQPEDSRRVLVKQVASLNEHFAQGTVGPDATTRVMAQEGYPFPAALGPESLDAALEAGTHLLDGMLFGLTTEIRDAVGRLTAMCRCSIYTLNDVFVAHVGISLLDPRSGTLADGWAALTETLKQGFSASALESASPRAFGLSVLYCATRETEAPAETYAREVRQLVASVSDNAVELADGVHAAATDLGQLWHTDAKLYPQAPHMRQDLWVLLSPGNDANVAAAVNRSYFDPAAPFVELTLARLKFLTYQAEFERNRQQLELQQESMNAWAKRLLRTIQRPTEARRSQRHRTTSDAFQDEIHDVATELAKYRAFLSLFRGIRRTLELARINFLINSATVISSEAARRLSQSDSQDSEALRILHERHREQAGLDEFFLGELGRMRGTRQQLEADLDYSESILERTTAMLQSGTEHLQILTHRELSEIEHHLVVDSAAVVASLLAFVAVEGVAKPLGLDKTLVGVGGVLSVAALSFSLLMWRARQGRLELLALAVTFGLIVSTATFAIAFRPEAGEDLAGENVRIRVAEFGVLALLLALAFRLVAWLRNGGLRHLASGFRMVFAVVRTKLGSPTVHATGSDQSPAGTPQTSDDAWLDALG